MSAAVMVPTQGVQLRPQNAGAAVVQRRQRDRRAGSLQQEVLGEQLALHQVRTALELTQLLAGILAENRRLPLSRPTQQQHWPVNIGTRSDALDEEICR